MESVLDHAEQIFSEVRELRRDLHHFPEVGLDLPQTQAAVLERLTSLAGLEITLGTLQTSITVVLRGQGRLPAGTRRPVVLLRGDMDALPVQEDTGLDYASGREGLMHACGHDMHTAALFGSLVVLHSRREDLIADVVFMFQPGEEAYHGAEYMITEGVLDAAGQRVDAAFGLHVFSSFFETGVFYSRPETLMAGCDELLVKVVGTGGHGSMPFLAKDPVPVAAEMIIAFQTLATRAYDPFDPVVITVGRLHAGTAGNIIPETAEFDASIRIFSRDHREKIIGDMERMCRGIADAHGLSVDLAWAPAYPVTVNDHEEYEYAQRTIESTLGPASFRRMEHPLNGSEDFSRVLEKVPGAFLCLGAASAEATDSEMNHSPRAIFDESVLPAAVAALSNLALERLPVPLTTTERAND